MQDTQQHDAIDVFVGVDIGKGQHHAVALDRNGKRLYNKAPPTRIDATRQSNRCGAVMSNHDACRDLNAIASASSTVS